MKLRTFRYLAILSAVGSIFALLAPTRAAHRPEHGGTLRVEIGASIVSLDPAVNTAASSEADARADLLPLVFETLTRIDASGAAQGWLADSWEHDASNVNWTLHLRRGVRFHDGSELTPDTAVSALSNLDSEWHVNPTADGIKIELAAPTPDFPSVIAEPRFALVRRDSSGTLSGTGPFKIGEWQPKKRITFVANEDCWAGRPFLDAVTMSMTRPAKQRAIDVQLGAADLIDLPPDASRQFADEKQHVVATSPVDLLALVFPRGSAATSDLRAREAVAKSIDRAAIVNFILQKQGEPAAGLLPQWLSGTEFLFNASSTADPAAARKLWAEIVPAPALVLGYDSDDAIEQAVAERIAVNGREAGVSIAARALPASGSTKAYSALLVRFRLTSASPRASLSDTLARFADELGNDVTPLSESATASERYAREQEALRTIRVVPLVHLPRIYGVSNRVRNFEIRGGDALNGWQLGNVWMEREAQ
jgi:ABC-type transport system substrate-binding protein